ncbi:hypothetical protein BH09MYX1_BH09MYX1_16690 [soil metagenome]
MLADELSVGAHGITFALPSTIELNTHERTSVRGIDRRTGVGWSFYVFPGMHLDLAAAHEALLRRDVGRHAGYLLDAMTRADVAAGRDVPETTSPRSALIALARASVDGADAITILHRMVLRPGREIVMGHLLVPLAAGLFEARWVASTNQTGYRETVLFERAKRRAGMDADGALTAATSATSTIDYDAEAEDAAFPAHPLTMARSARRWILDDAGITVQAPAPARTQAEQVVAPLGMAFVPPPRFVRDDFDATLFRRLSLAGTDGVEMLMVDPGGSAERLADHVVGEARSRYVESQVTNIEARFLGEDDEMASAVVEGDGHLGPLRMVLCARAFGAQRFFLAIATTTAQPTDSLRDEIETAMRTARLVV